MGRGGGGRSHHLSLVVPSMADTLQDEEFLEREHHERVERARREEEERLLASQREKERREREDQERKEAEERERLERERAEAAKAVSRGSGVRGVRGTRASMRGMRGTSVPRAGALPRTISRSLAHASHMRDVAPTTAPSARGARGTSMTGLRRPTAVPVRATGATGREVRTSKRG